MSEVTITSVTRPNNCGHILIEGTLDGVPVSRLVHLRQWKALLAETDVMETVLIVLAERVNAAGATTPAQIKAACEGQVIHLGAD